MVTKLPIFSTLELSSFVGGVSFTAYTPSQRNPFTVSFEDGWIKCTTAEKNVIKFNECAENTQLLPCVLSSSINFLSNENIRNSGIRIGSCQGEANPDTFEAFLRSYGTPHRLGSYFPPILEHIGVAEIFRHRDDSAKWIRLHPEYIIR